MTTYSGLGASSSGIPLVLSPLSVHLLLIGGGTLVAVASLWWTLDNRHKQATTEFGVFLGTVLLWGVVQLVEVGGTATVAYYASFAVEGVRAAMAVSWFYFTLTYAGYGAVVRSPAVRASAAAGTAYLLVFTAVPPVATALTFDTVQVVHDPFVNVVLQGTNPFSLLAQLVGYLFVGVGTVVLVYRFVSTQYTRAWQTLALLLSVAVVIFFDAVVKEVLAPVAGVDYSVVGASVASVVFILALYRGDLFGFVPVARDHVFHTIDSGVVVLNPDNVVVDANDAATSLLDTEIRVGADAETVLPDEIATDELVRTQTDGRTTVPLERGDAETVYDVAVSTLSEGGTPGGIVVTLRDITDHKRRERKLTQYETFVEASGDPLITLDADGQITYVNEAFVELTGYERETLLGSDPSLFASPEGIARAEETIRSLLSSSDERGTFEIELHTADGERVPCENHIALLPFEDEFRGTVGILRDISDRKERAVELERQNERLDQFASFVSHDLRNPLNVAAGHLSLARDECESDHLETVADAHERMQTLIDDLLALARSGETVGDLEEIDLASIATRCWQTVATRDVRLEVDTELSLRADPDRLQQLFENLFRNAVEHAGENVTVTVGSCDGGFYVADDGPGIPPDQREKVLQNGYSTSDQGIGLGLAIVRDVAEAHGWELRVTESGDGGARFELTDVDVEPG